LDAGSSGETGRRNHQSAGFRLGAWNRQSHPEKNIFELSRIFGVPLEQVLTEGGKPHPPSQFKRLRRSALPSLRLRRGRRTARGLWHFRGGPGGIAVCATKPYFHDETAAFLHLDGFFWPDGPVCPHCGPVGGKRDDLGKTQVGLRERPDCRKQLTVKVGTVFASAHIHSTRGHRPSSSRAPGKKARAHRIHRMLGVKYRTVWFFCERIRGRCALATLCGWRRGLVDASPYA
jgi:hypothetical protein